VSLRSPVPRGVPSMVRRASRIVEIREGRIVSDRPAEQAA
jgi:hypothetical protein